MATNHNSEPADCFVCHRLAAGIGVGAPQGDPKWVCLECAELAREIRGTRRLSAYELQARDDAGDAAGGYLDEIGRTDLADLTQDEWREFLRLVITEFGASIRRQIQAGAAPF